MGHELDVLPRSGPARQRKALLRKLIKELLVMSRDEILPTYRIPALFPAPGHQVELPGIEPPEERRKPPGGEMAPGMAGPRHEVELIDRCANRMETALRSAAIGLGPRIRATETKAPRSRRSLR